MINSLSNKFRQYQNFIGVALLTLVNVLGFSIMIPVLPFVIKEYNANHVTYGFLWSIYSICQFIAAPYLGALSDKYGRKKILLISQLGTFLSWLLFGLAWFMPRIPILGIMLPIIIISISRILDGLTGGNTAVAYAYLSDITPADKKAKYFGAVTAVFGLGFLIGPVIGGYSSSTSLGYLGTIIVASIISLFTLIFIQFFLTESLSPEHRNPTVHFNLKKELNLVSRIYKYRDNLAVFNLFKMWFFYSLAYGSYISIIILHIIDIFNLDTLEVSRIMLIVGFALIFNQIVIAKFVAHRLGQMRSLLLGLVLSAVGLIATSLTVNFYWFILFSLSFGMGFSLTIPTFKALFSNSVDKSQQGEVLGIDQSIDSFCLAVTGIPSTVLYALLGGWAFSVLTILVGIALWLYLAKYRQMYQQIEASTATQAATQAATQQ